MSLSYAIIEADEGSANEKGTAKGRKKKFEKIENPLELDSQGDNYENTELPIPSERPPLTSPPVAPPTSSDPSPSSSFSSQPSNRQNFPFLSISSVLLKRRQPRQALLNTFIQGESALYPLLKNNNDSNYRSLELDSLSIQLETNCSSSSSSISSSTCFFFPSSSSPPPTLTEPQILTPQEVSQALSIYFSQLEPSFKLFPTNSSRNYLSSRIEQFWSTTQTQGEVGRGEDFLEWKALFLVTVAGSAVVSTDSEWIEKGKELIKVASRIVLKDLRGFHSHASLSLSFRQRFGVLLKRKKKKIIFSLF